MSDRRTGLDRWIMSALWSLLGIVSTGTGMLLDNFAVGGLVGVACLIVASTWAFKPQVARRLVPREGGSDE